jgi:diguanylate cyclase (GGDEF)-like protein
MDPGIGSKDISLVPSIELPEDLRERLAGCKTLPSIPSVVMKIVDMCGDDSVSLGQIAKVLSRDPALAATVLKVANSAYYWVVSEVKTLDRAVCTMGVNATLSLVLSYSFVRILRNQDKDGFDYSYYWQRSVIAASAAKAMGKWSKSTHNEELFLAGLLQDIGMLVLSEAIPEKYGPLVSVANRDHQRLIALENELLATDHSKVGAWMLEHWNLPGDVRLSLAFSHEPKSNPRPELQSYVNAAALAGDIAEIWTNPSTVDAAARAREASRELLDMSAEDFDRIISETAKSIPDVTSFLNIDIGGEKRIAELMDRAHEALIYLNLQAQKQMMQMQDLAIHDGLTSIYNRGYLTKVLPQYMETARKMKQPLSLIFIDLDHFKEINDAHGHQVGDSVLISVAKVVKNAMRSSDVVARYGGEEFVCILPNTEEQAANLVSERLRKAIASNTIATEAGTDINITASFGCATSSVMNPCENPDALLDKADRCLYAAKQAGRNKVITENQLHQDLPAECLENSI